MPTPDGGTGRPAWVEIDLGAVYHNFQIARRAVGPHVAMFPVIKADGYGLGALAIADLLSHAGADGVCVALVEEAARLRHAGITRPIVLLSGLVEGLEDAVAALDLQPFVFDRQRLATLSRVAESTRITSRRKRLPLFLKVDTGMGRLGLDEQEVADAVAEVAACPGLQLAGLVSHLACADQPEHPENNHQYNRFRRIIKQCKYWKTPSAPAPRHSLANSAALLARPETHCHWVRPGILLYGVSPFFPANIGVNIGLRPVVRWCSQMIQVRDVAAGTAIGYGRTYITEKPARIAIVSAGYADGYNRLLSNHAFVLVSGQRAPVVGRVSMDMIAIDVSHLSHATPGHPVTLLGRDGEEAITVEEMALWQNSIPYEVLCNLGARVARHYITKPCGV